MEKEQAGKEIIVDGIDETGRSLFVGPSRAVVNETQLADLQNKVNGQFAHLKGLTDDRLVVLLGGLVAEQALDAVLAAFLPGFDSIRKNKDFTFSMRIDVLESANLLTKKATSALDCIRLIRNQFIHGLHIKRFADLEPKFLDSLFTHNKNLEKEFVRDSNEAENYELLVKKVSLVLWVYESHIEKFTGFIRLPETKKQFEESVKAGL